MKTPLLSSLDYHLLYGMYVNCSNFNAEPIFSPVCLLIVFVVFVRFPYCFSRSGKDCALKLTLLPPGTVSSEVVLDGKHILKLFAMEFLLL